MATELQKEVYRCATIDRSDMTLTEYCGEGVRTYNIDDILSRWDGVRDINIEITRTAVLPSSEG